MFADEISSQNENTDAGSMQNTWINLLLDWVNKCTEPAQEVRELNAAGEAFAQALGRYAGAPSAGAGPGAPRAAADLELFLCRQFNRLRLEDVGDDVARKTYIVSSVALFYCVARSAGAARAAGEVCARLSPRHQLLALLFCERLGGAQVTISNVEAAILEACESVEKYETTPERTSISLTLSDPFPLGTPSDFSRQSDGDTTAALKSLRSSVIAMQTSLEPSIAGSNHDPTVGTSPSGASSALLTETEVLSQSVDIIIPKKLDIPAGDAVGATTELYAEEKHVITPSTALPAESETTVITDMNVQIRKGGNFPYDSGITRQGSPRHVSFSRTDSFSPPPSRFRNPFPSRMLYYIQQRGHQYYPYRYQRRGWTSKNYLRCLSLSTGCLLVVLIFVLGFNSYIAISAGRLKEKFRNVTSSSSLVSVLDEDVDNDTVIITELEDILKNGRSVEEQKKLWECKDYVCQKVTGIESKPKFYSSSSRCTLLCGGPQIWPLPTEHLQFGKALVALSSERLQYTVTSAPSDSVQKYLVQAFGYFYKDVVKLESLGKKSSNRTLDLPLKTMIILMSVEHDPEPRLRLTTDEAYLIEIGTDGNQLMVHLSGSSFCGVRLGLETLSQMLMLDHSTGHLITLNSAVVKDAPNHRYRGLMLDTARNYIPIPDIIRTIDAMASVKLNTFHWRITDATSFPLLVPEFSDLFKHGAYERSMVYTKEDVTYIAARAGVRGVRVLLELALPGPAGRAWSWSRQASCPNTTADSCRNLLCLRLNVSESLFDVLQYLYTEVLEMTSVDDIFHLSDGIFSLTNCQLLMEDRKGFLSRALETLKLANHGTLPSLPIVWYTGQVAEEREQGRLGVQVHHWSEGLTERLLARFRVIQSTKWDLSCEMKNQRCYRYRTWQEMYEWRSWKSIDALSIEGGEAILWTDLVNSGNLDMHLWPRAAAVAERLWADAALNATPTLSASVYVRMDHHLSRLRARGVAAAPLWPRWCRTSPWACLDALRL